MDGPNVDNQDGGKDYDYDTGLVDANVMDKDESEGNDELVKVGLTSRQKLMPAHFKECFF